MIFVHDSPPFNNVKNSYHSEGRKARGNKKGPLHGPKEINPSIFPGLKLRVCSGLILSGAFDPSLKGEDFGVSSVERLPRSKFQAQGTTHKFQDR
jgi:hypothetical protein